jgi:acetyl-CoA carboxylase carboxyl transferase subunit beta
VVKGKTNNIKLITAIMDFRFMGGSMGMQVGEGIVKAADEAKKNKCPLLIIASSGGARMQEGILALMQMPRTIAAIENFKELNLPYLVLFTNPTTGGVSASFTMVGDILLAEPGALIGFAGPRVIKKTVNEDLPENFQKSEFLLEHGMIDLIVDRKTFKDQLALLLKHLYRKN